MSDRTDIPFFIGQEAPAIDSGKPDREMVKEFEAQRGIQQDALNTDYRAAMQARAEGRPIDEPATGGTRDDYLARMAERAKTGNQ